MIIVVATANNHKIKELAPLFPDFTLKTPSELGITFTFEETGSTFLENSLGKALALHQITGMTTMADDSGLCVAALGGEPGIYSARYGSVIKGRELQTAERNQFLLDNMHGIQNREAAFICCMSLVFSITRLVTVQESVEGYITEKPSGTKGFGYDPLFYLPSLDCTMAELNEEQKNRISHRGKAARALFALLNQEMIT